MLLIPVVHLDLRISPQTFEKIQNGPNGILWGWGETDCAAKAIFYCPSMNSHRPRSQNIPKERTLNPEKDSTRKRPRSHVSLEKSS
jgi:hypothetical protein